MKFRNYEKRHRKFSLNPSSKIQKNKDDKNSFIKTMRGISGPYHSFVPHQYILKTHSIYRLLFYTFIFTLILVFSIYFPARLTFKIPFLNSIVSFYPIRDFAYIFLLRYIYLWYKNQQKIIISDDGIQIDKNLYGWDEIKSLEFKKIFNKTPVWYINTTSMEMILKIKPSSENKEGEDIHINLRDHSVNLNELKYIVSVCQKRHQKKIIKKNIRLEEKFMYADK